ncbi:MAG: hypothetical protein KC912_04920 [Proteobacteria bacterium]|nr:hypothetical protein [Pseudomonadota bacterium]
MLVLLLALFAHGGTPLVLPATQSEIEVAADAQPAVEAALAAMKERRFSDAATAFHALSEASDSADYAYLSAVAAYEAGDLRSADRACEQGLSRDSAHAPLLALGGLVYADLGRGDEALARLRDAESHAGDDGVLRARIGLNVALVHLDLGELTKAQTYLDDAERQATESGASDVLERVRQNQAVLAAALGKGQSKDAIASVNDHLRKGRTAEARQALPSASGQDRRAEVRRALGEGAILRAEGRFDDAAAVLQAALVTAREGGLTRETAALLAELGSVFRVGGRPALAKDPLQEAVGLVASGSFRLNEVSYRVEAGRVSLALDDVESAAAQLKRARTAAANVEDPMAAPRLDELEGAVLARKGDGAGAETALIRARSSLEVQGWHADAARVGVLLVELHAGQGGRKLDRSKKAALTAFSDASEPLGPVHVSIAEGVGLARAKKSIEALEAFMAAADSAAAAGGPRAEVLGALARENAAQVLVSMGQSPEVVAQAEAHGLSDTLQQARAFDEAKEAYASGLAAFEHNDYERARTQFHDAWTAFDGMGEGAYARQARVGRAWATLNASGGGKAEERLILLTELVQEAIQVEDSELAARAMAAQAIAAAELDHGDVDEVLRDALRATEKLGLDRLSGSLYAEVAERPGSAEERAGAAKRALELLGDDARGVYAIYSVAVDAYNADHYALAVELCESVDGKAGDLQADVAQVLEAAKAQL